MNKLFLGAMAIVVLGFANASFAGEFAYRVYADHNNRLIANQTPWHGNYAYLPWNEPAALVVPPTVQSHSAYSWGVAMTEVRPVWHQYGPRYPGGGRGGPFYSTPRWPSHTDQFGVYPVRGPWKY